MTATDLRAEQAPEQPRDRAFFRRQVLGLFAELDVDNNDVEMRRAVVLGYLRGSVAARTPEQHAAATLGALDALDALDESTQLEVSP